MLPPKCDANTEMLWLSDGWDPGQKTVSVYSLQAMCELLLCAYLGSHTCCPMLN